MEFYGKRPYGYDNPYPRFQFPTGWNSTRRPSLAGAHFQFQFPTGWNSTLAAVHEFGSPAQFQFPTGWNSTIRGQKMINVGECFNSQRDGILPKLYRLTPRIGLQFQFPTGWNSTPYSGYTVYFQSQCFNSQRDGILPAVFGSVCSSRLFQFPTGWNSTARILPFF